ncbi:MAG: cysteine--tRNA ligase [Clostridia bacterium]
MEIFFYNTLNNKKEEFKPIDHPKVGIYTCGPTVYGRAHIGNLRAYIFADSLNRVLRYNNYEVDQVMNVTDVGHLVTDGDDGEDKMLVAARREKKSPWQIAEMYTNLFIQDIKRLNIILPNSIVKATDKINEMIEYVKKLMQNGFAYETSDGIYFDISKYPEYGQLSGIDLESQQAGARVEVNTEKRNPHDFAVWKKAPKNHIMQWDSPWGKGYPGWHIECSAISHNHFGNLFDIHTGGVDHIPIHHENEIAQSYGLCQTLPSNYWLHSEFVLVDKGKMSKSLGNTYSLDDIKDKGFSPLAYKYMCLNAHYRKQINFTWKSIESAQKSIDRLRMGTREVANKDPLSEEILKEYERGFHESINDDLNIPKALGILWELVRDEKGGVEASKLVQKMDSVFALDLFKKKEMIELNQEIIALIKKREDARKDKNWQLADDIRDQLAEIGIELLDTPEGTKWKRK